MKYLKTTIIVAALAPLAILSFTEACTPMKAIQATTNTNSTGADDYGLWSSNAADVCSTAYAPSIGLLQSKAAAPTEYQHHFDKKKVYLTKDSTIASKAVKSLKNQKIVVIINRDCSVNDPQSLSAKVFAQAAHFDASLKRLALEYTISDDISPEDFEASAETDPCVRGVTLSEKLKHASLDIPSTGDPKSNEQVYLKNVNYAHAYKHLASTNNNTPYNAKVGFVDTGVQCQHPDLLPILTSGCGYNVIDSALPPEDDDGHGTNVAGIVGAISGNNLGIIGIASNAIEITAIKALDASGSGLVSEVVNGIQFAIDNNLDVLNVSIESDTQIVAVEDAVADAVAAGIVVVMAAGNQAKELKVVQHVSPASVGKNLAGAIAVGSIDDATGNLSKFSNFGSYVEIAAVGALNSHVGSSTGGIYSTAMGSSYSRLMGTSQAAPMITAAAALLVRFFKSRGVSYTPAQIEQIILASTDQVSGLQVSGGRVINFSKLTRNAYSFAGATLCN